MATYLVFCCERQQRWKSLRLGAEDGPWMPSGSFAGSQAYRREALQRDTPVEVVARISLGDQGHDTMESSPAGDQFRLRIWNDCHAMHTPEDVY